MWLRTMKIKLNFSWFSNVWKVTINWIIKEIPQLHCIIHLQFEVTMNTVKEKFEHDSANKKKADPAAIDVTHGIILSCWLTEASTGGKKTWRAHKAHTRYCS